jgi:hypothetical protein
MRLGRKSLSSLEAEYVFFRTVSSEALRMMPVRSGSKLLIRPEDYCYD